MGENFVTIIQLVTFSLCVFSDVVLSVSNFCVDHGYTPANGTRTPEANEGYSYFEGSVIRYSCNENFVLEPNEPKQACTLDQSGGYVAWFPLTPPSCVELPTCNAPAISYGVASKNVYHEGDYLNVICEDGYEERSENNSVCLKTGEWSNIPLCTEKYCPAPTEIAHGSIQIITWQKYSSVNNTWPPGTEALYTCDDGYHIEHFNSYQDQRSFCQKGEWSGEEPKCIKEGCSPPDLRDHESYYGPIKDFYKVGEYVKYYCYSQHVPQDGTVARYCNQDHTWTGRAPTCGQVTTTPMPYTSNGNVFCTTPLPVTNGEVLCCNDNQVSLTTKDPTYCCPVNGVVQFVCDVGYAIKGDPTQWVCGAHGDWMLVNYPEYGVPPSLPTCQSNTTRPDPNALTYDMLKPVLGTAAGVLVILSAAIIVAFCRPKLKDMKRRWREMREDEEELIIDGQRILLPTYEEAVSNTNDPYVQLPRPPNSSYHGDMPGTSQSNPGSVFRNQDTISSRDDDSCILQVHEESSSRLGRHLHPSNSSDEDILIPFPRGEKPKTNNTPEMNLPLQSSLVLEVGSSVDSSILINKTPEVNPEENNLQQTPDQPVAELSNISQVKQSNEDRNKLTPTSTPTRKEFPAFDCVLENGYIQLLPNYDSNSDSESGLDLIYPRNLMQPVPSEQPHYIVGSDVHTLLTYPLKVVQDENSDSSESNNENCTIEITNDEQNATNEIEDTRVTENETTSTSQKDGIQEDNMHLSVPSDHVCLVTSSDSSKGQQSDDITGSTTV